MAVDGTVSTPWPVSQFSLEYELLQAITEQPNDLALRGAGIAYFGRHLADALAAYQSHGSDLLNLLPGFFAHEVASQKDFAPTQGGQHGS